MTETRVEQIVRIQGFLADWRKAEESGDPYRVEYRVGSKWKLDNSPESMGMGYCQRIVYEQEERWTNEYPKDTPPRSPLVFSSKAAAIRGAVGGCIGQRCWVSKEPADEPVEQPQDEPVERWTNDYAESMAQPRMYRTKVDAQTNKRSACLGQSRWVRAEPIEVPEPVEQPQAEPELLDVWANLNPSGLGVEYPTRGEAREHADSNAIRLVHLREVREESCKSPEN